MAAYDLYGVKDISIIVAKLNVEELLGVSFEERESAYQGGVYYRFDGEGGEGFVLKENIDPFDGEAVEQLFSEYPVLLYVDKTTRSDEIGDFLNIKFCLLRHELFD
ncbi:hypothetical protein [Pseudomonas sp. Q11]|uniref:hypothetical protein n=1 Tax=Pseudomonas sp. Q11 TaxID=2968470 RepID=UPI00210C1026|nr:hypothetical protein [Pseudomonas sp. Q11]MCQ6260174.1 hypothetical protein [Pseudomonas sp. Q11]